jgi:hypothetical protein
MTCYPIYTKMFYEAAHAQGLPCWTVPAIGYNHVLVGKEDNWAWTRTDNGRAGWTLQQCGAWLQAYTDGALAWSYGIGVTDQVESRTYLEAIGLTRPYVPMIDGLSRNNDAQIAATARALWAEFGSIGVFVPDSRVGPKLTETIKQLRDMQ